MRTSLKVTTGAALQLSDAVKVTAKGMELHSTVKLAGAPLRIGAVTSCTVIICETDEVFEQASVAVQVRVKI